MCCASATGLARAISAARGPAVSGRGGPGSGRQHGSLAWSGLVAPGPGTENPADCADTAVVQSVGRRCKWPRKERLGFVARARSVLGMGARRREGGTRTSGLARGSPSACASIHDCNSRRISKPPLHRGRGQRKRHICRGVVVEGRGRDTAWVGSWPVLRLACSLSACVLPALSWSPEHSIGTYSIVGACADGVHIAALQCLCCAARGQAGEAGEAGRQGNRGRAGRRQGSASAWRLTNCPPHPERERGRATALTATAQRRQLYGVLALQASRIMTPPGPVCLPLLCR